MGEQLSTFSLICEKLKKNSLCSENLRFLEFKLLFERIFNLSLFCNCRDKTFTFPHDHLWKIKAKMEL